LSNVRDDCGVSIGQRLSQSSVVGDNHRLCAIRTHLLGHSLDIVPEHKQGITLAKLPRQRHGTQGAPFDMLLIVLDKNQYHVNPPWRPPARGAR
jgi:hypothetical protein